MIGAFVAYFILEYARLSYCGAIEPGVRRKGLRCAG